MSRGVLIFRPYLAILLMLFAVLLGGCATSLKPGYEQTISASESIRGISIAVSYQGGAFYHVELNNTLPRAIELMWDESTYVTTVGRAVRLLHVRRYAVPQQAPAQQPPSIIPPHEQFQAGFIGDEWIDCVRRGCTPQPRNSSAQARIHLAFRINGKVIRWQGDIAFAPSRLH